MLIFGRRTSFWFAASWFGVTHIFDESQTNWTASSEVVSFLTQNTELIKLIWYIFRPGEYISMRGSSPDWSQTFVSALKRPDLLWGTRSLIFNEYWVSFARVKRAVGHSPPFSAEVMTGWSCTSTPVCLHGVDRGSLTLSDHMFEKLQEPIPVAALGLRVRIPPLVWMFLSCESCVLFYM